MKLMSKEIDGYLTFYIKGKKKYFLKLPGIKYAIESRNRTGKEWSCFYYKSFSESRKNEPKNKLEVKWKNVVMREYCKQFCVENLI